MIDFAALKKQVSDSLTQATAVAGAAKDVVDAHNSLLSLIEQAENAVPTLADVKAMVAKVPD